MRPGRVSKDRYEYTVAWIAPLPIEQASAIVMLDEEHSIPRDFRQSRGDSNSYKWGSIMGHNIVITSQSVYGITDAAVTITQLLSSFPLIKFALLVGIGGGVPRPGYDIRLGDVVVSYPSGTSGGIIQYDIGKAKADGVWERKDSINRPPEILLKALNSLQATQEIEPLSISQWIRAAGERHYEWKSRFGRPKEHRDRLFKPDYLHSEESQDCLDCATGYEVERPERTSDEPAIHYGIIASGNTLVKDAQTREKIAALDKDCICIDMEAAGIANSIPCLTIRGISDYADTHKTQTWQRCAAAAAVAFAKELLQHTPKDGESQILIMSKARDASLSTDEIEDMELRKRRMEDLAKRTAKLLPQLHVCSYRDRKDRNVKRLPQTCDWFTQHPHYLHWLQSPGSSPLWVSADPGTGKSVLCRYLIDEKLPSKNRIVCYFFFKDDTLIERKSATAICAILHQLVKLKPKLHQHPAIENLLMHGDNFTDSFWILWETFIAIISDSEIDEEVVCVFDAFDECIEADRDNLMQAINDFNFSPNDRRHFKLLLTSRPYDHVKRGFRELISRTPIIHLKGEGELEVAHIRKEIIHVVQYQVDQIAVEKQLTHEEREYLLSQLTLVGNQTYLWIRIVIEMIRNSHDFSRQAIRRAVSELPQSLEEAYEKILSQCPDQHKAREILKLIVAAQSPLHLNELSMILGLQDEHRVYEDLLKEAQSKERTEVALRQLCGLFVVVIDSRVHLLHQTAREFLLNPISAGQYTPTSASIASSTPFQQQWKWSMLLTDCHKAMATACVQFLLLERLPLKKVHSFGAYASVYWDLHLREAKLSKTDSLLESAMKLCSAELRAHWIGPLGQLLGTSDTKGEAYDNNAPKNYKTTRSKAKKSSTESMKLVLYNHIPHKQSPAIVIAAWTGVVALVQLCLDNAGDIDARAPDGMTGLSWAAIRGHVDVVKLLLKANAETDDDILYPAYKPLHNALRFNQGAIISLLVKNGARLDAKDYYGTHAIHRCAGNGQTDLVRMLLDLGADVNSKDSNGSTPLHWAAFNGQHETCVVLLNKGAEINGQDSKGTTSLCGAVRAGNERTVNYLLENGAEINLPNHQGQTILMSAAEFSSTTMVDLLLDRGAGLNMQDKGGFTALFYSVKREQTDVLKVLLDRGAKVNTKSTKANTALNSAVYYGRMEAAKLLLQSGAAVNAQNRFGETPLNHVVCSTPFSSKMLKTMLDAGAYCGNVDICGRTASLLACLDGIDAAVRIMYQTGMDVNEIVGHGCPDRWEHFLRTECTSQHIWNGWTLLHGAAYTANESLTRYLLSKGAIVDAKDYDNRTPLFWAVMGGQDNFLFRGQFANSKARLFLGEYAEEVSFEAPYSWTKLGTFRPIWADRQKLIPYKKRYLEQRFPEGYAAAQMKVVAILLAHGADPKVRGVHWRYLLWPGFRCHRRERKAMFELLKGTKEQAIAVSNAQSERHLAEASNGEISREQEDSDMLDYAREFWSYITVGSTMDNMGPILSGRSKKSKKTVSFA